MWRISIHAPAKGATISTQRFPRRESFQSTLPRRERRDLAVRKEENCIISIHAPAKGATINQLLNNFYKQTFQSTLPRRERLYSQAPARAEYIISIHAPAKGATPLPSHLPLSCPHFNPRSREGSDVHPG